MCLGGMVQIRIVQGKSISGRGWHHHQLVLSVIQKFKGLFYCVSCLLNWFWWGCGLSFVLFWERSSTYGLTFLKNYQLECFIKVGCHSVSGSETDILENFVHSVQFESRTSWVRHIQTRVMSTRDLEMASLKTAVAQAFHDVPRRSTSWARFFCCSQIYRTLRHLN